MVMQDIYICNVDDKDLQFFAPAAAKGFCIILRNIIFSASTSNFSFDFYSIFDDVPKHVSFLPSFKSY